MVETVEQLRIEVVVQRAAERFSKLVLELVLITVSSCVTAGRRHDDVPRFLRDGVNDFPPLLLVATALLEQRLLVELCHDARLCYAPMQIRMHRRVVEPISQTNPTFEHGQGEVSGDWRFPGLVHYS